ncbi:MAG: hypothetical protein J6J36_02190 [Clostridia bacterium]|nr:hypothetical protein [Clostridia bacterium]
MFDFLGLKKLIIGVIVTSTISTVGFVGFDLNKKDVESEKNIQCVSYEQSISKEKNNEEYTGENNRVSGQEGVEYQEDCYEYNDYEGIEYQEDCYEYNDYRGIEYQEDCYEYEECESDEDQAFNHKDGEKQEQSEIGTEGMKNKLEDPGFVKITEAQYFPDITGYATSYYEAEIDLLLKKGVITLYRDVWDSDEIEIVDRKELVISDEDAERIYTYYLERLNNKFNYDEDALEEHTMNLYEEEYIGSLEQRYYYNFEANDVSDVYVFGNAEDIQFLHNLFNSLK